MMSDYRVDIKVRNNVFLYRLEKAGYKSIGELCRVNNKMSYNSKICSIVNMTESPFNSAGGWHTQIQWAADRLNCAPEDLFNETQLHTVLKTNKKQVQINEAELKFMLEQADQNSLSLEDMTYNEQFKNTIQNALKTVTPREQKILEMRFGFDGEPKTLEECAVEFGVNRERIRQIEHKALRKLRNPNRCEQLREFNEDGINAN